MKSKRQRISALFLAFAILVGPLPPMTVHAADTTNAVTKGKWVLNCGITTTISYYEAVCNDLPYTKIDVYCTKDGNLCLINPISYNHCVTCGVGLNRIFCPNSNHNQIGGQCCVNTDCSSNVLHGSGGEYYGKGVHVHAGSSSQYGGCYTKAVYNHTHTGSAVSGGGCYSKYIPAVSFIDNSGAHGVQPAPVTNVEPGQTYTMPKNTFMKNDYRFTGWSVETEQALYQPGQTVVMPSTTTDFVYKAVWEADTAGYQVEHYLQDLSGDTYTWKDEEQLQGIVNATVTAQAKSYTYFHENMSHSNRKASGQILSNGSLVLRLYYDRDVFTITFESNGGSSVPSQNGVLYGGTAVEPIPPSKTGYTFLGWYDQSLTTPYSFGTPMTEGITLYAKWEGRTDTPYQVEHYRQDTQRTGYVLFEGEDLAGTTDATVTATAKRYPGFHENTSHAGRVPGGELPPDGSLVLRLYYDRNVVNVSLDPNGGAVRPAELQAFYGCAYGPLPVPTRTNFQFIGWLVSPDDRFPVSIHTPLLVPADHTLTAAWVAEDYGVVDGSVEDTDGNPIAGVKITIRAGNVDYMTAVTDSEGRFSITDVAYGPYNLVAGKGGITVTTKLEVKEVRVTQDIQMPKGKTNSVVEVVGAAPELVVGGLDALFKSPEIYTSADEAVVSGGGAVELKMTITPVSAEDLGADAAKLAALTSDAAALLLTVTVDKTVQPAHGPGASSRLSELPRLVELYLPFQVKPGCRVLRIHDGAAEELKAEPNENGEYIELKDGMILLHVSRFSTYAVTLPPEPDSDQVYPNDSDGGDDDRDDKPVSSKKPGAAGIYEDVLPEDWFYDAVAYVTEQGLMDGTGAGRFSPLSSTTRGMLVTILWRMEGRPRAEAPLAFPDVDPTGCCAGAVAWAHETGVVLGYDTGLYGPNDPITKEQLALILHRYSGHDAADTEFLSGFPDGAAVSDWAREAVAWAAMSGLMQGNEDGYLKPQGLASRAEAAAVFHRLCS